MIFDKNVCNSVLNVNTPLYLYVLFRNFILFFQREETILHIACRTKQITIVRLLLRNGAKVDPRSMVRQLNFFLDI